MLSVFIQEPQFQGQTKDRLNNPELLSAVDAVVRPALEHWLNHNISVAEAIVARIILSARAREASRAAQAEVSRKSATSTRLNLPGKLSDCYQPHAATASELFIVEGDSAGGSAKQGRDRATTGDPAAARQGAQHRKRVARQGAREQGTGGPGDGARLRSRARTSTWRSCATARSSSSPTPTPTAITSRRCCLPSSTATCPQLITSGKVFLAQPPLYRIDIGKETFWALDDAQKAAIAEAARQKRQRES